MKKNVACFLVALVSVFGFFSPVFADLESVKLELAKLAEDPQRVGAVGQAVLTAANEVYAKYTDSTVIQGELIKILNEVAATGNESAIRYALVAVIMAGGSAPDALTNNITAINNSNCFLDTRYRSLTAEVVGAARSLMGGNNQQGGGNNQQGGGNQHGGGDQHGGGNNNGFLRSLGLDPNNPFAWGSLTGHGDNDLEATPD